MTFPWWHAHPAGGTLVGHSTTTVAARTIEAFDRCWLCNVAEAACDVGLCDRCRDRLRAE